MSRFVLGLVAAGLLLGAVPAQGQHLNDLFSHLFTFGDCGEPLCLDVAAAVHGQHYNPSIVQGEHDLLRFLSGSIGASLGSLPFAAASSGVAFRFEAGLPVAVATSPGPIFAERARTLGPGQLLLGFNFSGLSMSSLRGIPLDDLSFTFTHQNVGDPALGEPFWENDVIEVDLDLDVNILVASVFASYGLTERLDVSVLVPIVRSSLSGRSNARITHWRSDSPHWFLSPTGEPTNTAAARAEGSATGIGDVAIRMKAGLAERDDVGLALLADLRLPTGTSADFHGAGAASFRVLGVGSAQVGDFAPHVNLGFANRAARNQANSLLATVGFDQRLSDWATLAVELVGEYQVEESPLVLPQPMVFTAPEVRTVELTEIPDRRDHLFDLGFGMRFDAPGGALITTHALVPFLNGGARPDFMWTVGLQRSF